MTIYMSEAQAATLFPMRKVRKQDMPIEIQMKAYGLPPWETEYQFAKSLGRLWKADYCWPDPTYRIIFEVEGGSFGNAVHVGVGAYQNKTRTINGEKIKERVEIPPNTIVRVGGGHNTGAGLEKDIEKYNCAAVMGWMVIRGTTGQIRDGLAIKWLVDAFKSKGWVPPKPLPEPVPTPARRGKTANTLDF